MCTLLSQDRVALLFVSREHCQDASALLTTDDIPDITNLNIWLNVNSEFKQRSNTEKMIFNVPFLVHYISQFMTLLPGYIIATGTPSGVGMNQKSQQFLQSNDIVEYGV